MGKRTDIRETQPFRSVYIRRALTKRTKKGVQKDFGAEGHPVKEDGWEISMAYTPA